MKKGILKSILERLFVRNKEFVEMQEDIQKKVSVVADADTDADGDDPGNMSDLELEREILTREINFYADTKKYRLEQIKRAEIQMNRTAQGNDRLVYRLANDRMNEVSRFLDYLPILERKLEACVTTEDEEVENAFEILKAFSKTKMVIDQVKKNKEELWDDHHKSTREDRGKGKVVIVVPPTKGHEKEDEFDGWERGI